MKHPWLAYLIVALLSIAAGVAIGGLPDNSSVDATIVRVSTVPETTDSAANVADTTEPEVTQPATTVPDTTVPDTTQPATTQPTTTSTVTTQPDPGNSVPVELPDRSELRVVAANGANVAGAASRVALRLEEIGYVDVLPLNGSDIFEFTVVYYAEGFEDSAVRLAADLDLLPDFVEPIENSPSVADLPADVELLVYVGLDRA